MEATPSRVESGGPFVAESRIWVANSFLSAMEKDYLTLKRASANGSSDQWNDADFDVLADGIVVGRIFKTETFNLHRSHIHGDGPALCECDSRHRSGFL
jgi:hypothetical protein